MSHSILAGSERTTLPGAMAIGKADPGERLEVTVLVRRQQASELAERVKQLAKPGAAGSKSAGHMTRADFARRHGAATADFALIKTFAATYGLAVVQQDAARRSIILAGTAGQFESAFDVELHQFSFEGGTYRGRTGAIQIPTELTGVVQAVLGLDNRPAARPHLRGLNGTPAAATKSFTPSQIAKLYGFPGGTGKDETIALIELGGGFRTTDLKTYFNHLGMPAPKVTAISVDHARNHPTGNVSGPDGEVMLDIEVAGAVAPAAHLAVYFAPNTDAGFLNAITTAVHDSANAPSVISISWGSPEANWTAQAMTAFDQAFQDAAALGITVLAAAGDQGATDGLADGRNHVEFPASSPHATACGGTHLQALGTSILSETVWNDGPTGGATGGGISSVFGVPSWQSNLSTTDTNGRRSPLTNRGVPDIAGDADPASGYLVRVDGQNTVFGGTSAVAPLWAGLIALINQAKGAPRGFINPALYANPTAMTDIKVGNNGGFLAAAGWDACTGLGRPNGADLAKVL